MTLTVARRFIQDPPELAALRARVYADAETRLRRTLHPAELNIDMVAIDRALETGKARLRSAIEAEKRRKIRELTRGRPARVHLQVTDAMLSSLVALHREGARQAREELRALGVEPRRAFADTPPSLDHLQAALAGRLGLVGRRVDTEYGGVAAKIAVGDIGEMSAATMAREIDRLVPGALDAASRLVSGALDAGRGDIFSLNSDLIGTWLYTAVMDANTCPECDALDATEYDSWDEIQTVLPGGGPNPNCDGNGRCRCMAVPSSTAGPGSGAQGYDDIFGPGGGEEARAAAADLAGQLAVGALRAPNPEDMLAGLGDQEALLGQKFLGLGNMLEEEVVSVDASVQAKVDVQMSISRRLDLDPEWKAATEPRWDPVTKNGLGKGDVFRSADGIEYTVEDLIGGFGAKTSDLQLIRVRRLPDDPRFPGRIHDDEHFILHLEKPLVSSSTGEEITLPYKPIESLGRLERKMDTFPINASARGGTDTERIVDQLVSNWAGTSADSDPWALAMQRAIADEFGLPYAKFLNDREAQSDAAELYRKYEAVFRRFARAMYDETQYRLELSGVDEIVLYRGQGLRDEDILDLVPGLGRDSQEAIFGEVLLQPASSFSSHYPTAHAFSRAEGTLIAVRVPRERILGSARTGFGCLNEREFVLLAAKEGERDEMALLVSRGRGMLRSRDGFWGKFAEGSGGLPAPGSDVFLGDVSAVKGAVVEYGGSVYEVVGSAESHGAVMVDLRNLRTGSVITRYDNSTARFLYQIDEEVNAEHLLVGQHFVDPHTPDVVWQVTGKDSLVRIKAIFSKSPSIPVGTKSYMQFGERAIPKGGFGDLPGLG